MDKRAIAKSFGDAAKSYDQHAAFQRHVATTLLQQIPAIDQKEALIVDLGLDWSNDPKVTSIISGE